MPPLKIPSFGQILSQQCNAMPECNEFSKKKKINSTQSKVTDEATDSIDSERYCFIKISN